MTIDPRTPVIIGVGQLVNRVDEGEEPLEPHELMTEVTRLAAADAGTTRASTDAEIVAVVPPFSWRYRDPGRLVADGIGATDAATWFPSMGGNTPQMLVNRLAGAIARGETDLGVVVGGEAFRTRMQAKKAGAEPDWVRQADEVTPTWSDGVSITEMFHPAEAARGVLAATAMYPMYENALWHASGRTLAEHLAEVGRMWADFSVVAAGNPYAWRRESFTAEEITTPTAENRMIGSPYTKRMVSNPDVDMAAGCILASVERARDLGVSRDRWVFPLAGTDGYDPFMSERLAFTASPAIGIAGNRALQLAGVGVDDLAHLDLYSCFPSAVQLACKELRIDPRRRLTVYGGLCFAGGPWNNPVSHAIATMVGVLREDPRSLGLVTANGGSVQKHAFGVYSTEPPTGGFRHEHPQDEIDARGRRGASLDYDGPVTIEAWTVMHDRDGEPDRAIAATLTPDGVRVWGGSTDPDLMRRFVTDDVAGTPARVTADGTMTLS